MTMILDLIIEATDQLSLNTYQEISKIFLLSDVFTINVQPPLNIVLESNKQQIFLTYQTTEGLKDHRIIKNNLSIAFRVLEAEKHLQLFQSFNIQSKNSWAIEFSTPKGTFIMFPSTKCSKIRWNRVFSSLLIKKGFYDEYTAYQSLGRGATATVTKFKSRSNYRLFAVKSISKEYLFHPSHSSRMEMFMNEIKLLRSVNLLNSSRIVKLYQIYETVSSYNMVMGLSQGPTLTHLLIQNKNKFQAKKIRQIIRELLLGLIILHKQRIVHRDIKPCNLIVEERGNALKVVILDLGIATKIDQDKYISPRCGSWGFVAPEIIAMKQDSRIQNTSCDIFSAGCIFHLLLTGTFLFGESREELKLNNHQMRFDLASFNYGSHSLQARNLLEKMLTVDHKARITAEEALQHPYFQEIDTLKYKAMDEKTRNYIEDVDLLEGSVGRKRQKIEDNQ